MRKQWLPYLFVILICTSIILNAIYQIPLFDCLPYANFHTLGIGALLAWLYYYKLDSKILSVIQKYKMIAFIIFISILVWSYNTRNIERHVIVAIQETFLMLTTGIIVLNSVTGWPTSLKFIFNNKTLHHIGKISYGIYLYHFIIPLFINLLEIKIPAISYYIPKTVFGNFIFLVCLTYITALISYNIFEIKFLKLKTNFTN
jgi:peptidoglycan/LPS O-acetylase OafA/YrhL